MELLYFGKGLSKPLLSECIRIESIRIPYTRTHAYTDRDGKLAEGRRAYGGTALSNENV